MAFEYFDVPYRYNETCIKLLFQNPYTLYAFWDVSDDDEQAYIEKYGEHSYYNSRIYLEITNTTNGKKFEVDVNPFAKTWFIHITEPNCKYVAKLCRTINNEKVDIITSNSLMVPTDAPHFPPDTTFTFVNNKTSEVAFTFSQPQAIEIINKVGVFTVDVLPQINQSKTDKENIHISLNNQKYNSGNPSSISNIGSGGRYLYKEGVNE